MNTRELLRKKRAEILAIAAKHGASNVRIFGSVARSEDTTTSDVDILVDMHGDRSLLDLVALKQDIEELLGRRADVLTEESISRYLRDRIRAEARPL
ncbi:MAG: nucleotidyltransferase family protein [Proteobacteria bacterium]|nr:nucleotidyltransferase family protein [Pseudomonadota bacterium]